MTVLLTTPKIQFFDNNGNPLSGGKVYTYQAGTVTPKDSFKDVGGTLNTNPVILDSAGRADIWLTAGGSYKIEVTESDDTPVFTTDDITAFATSANVADGSITNAKLANMGANSIKANNTAISAVATDMPFAVNTFPSRASTGNLAAKPITDFALTILDDADATAVKATLGITSTVALLATATASASATLDFTAFSNSTYISYFFVIDNLILSAAAALWCRMSTDGGATYVAANTTYRWNRRYTTMGVVGPTDTLVGDSTATDRQRIELMQASAGTGDRINGELRLYGASSTSKHGKSVSFNGTFAESSLSSTISFGVTDVNNFTAAAVNALRLLPASGTFTSGTVRMYGIRNA